MSERSIHMDNLEQYAGSDRPGLWVPSERVSVHRLPRPGAPRRKWEQLLPWLLEEQLLVPVESIHPVILAEEADALLVAAVSHEDMQTWLAEAARVGVTPNAMLPDYLALPWQTGSVSLALRSAPEAGQEPVVVARYSQWQGFAAPAGLMPGLLSALEAGAGDLDRVFYIPPEQIPSSLWQQEADCRGELSWQQGLPPGANLLTGDYASRPAQGYLSAWWPVAALLLLAVGLGWGTLAVGSRTLAAELNSLDQSRVNWFRTLFPAAEEPAVTRVFPDRPVDLPAMELGTHQSVELLVRQRFAERERIQQGAMPVMVALDPVLSACDCELSEVTVSQATAELAVAAGDADRLQASLSELSGFQIAVVERNETVFRVRVSGAGQ